MQRVRNTEVCLIIRSFLLLILIGFSAIPFLLISAMFFTHNWIAFGAALFVVYHFGFALFGGNVALSRVGAKKISKDHKLHNMVQNFSCLLGISPLKLKITNTFESKIFLIERIFSPGYLVFGEKVISGLTDDELKALTYFILHRNKSGEGYLKLILASTTYIYTLPFTLLKLDNIESLRVLMRIYTQPLLRVKYYILNGIFDSIFKQKIDSFHEGDLRSAIYKIIKFKQDSKEEALLSDFDIINIDASKESFGQKNFESSLGIV